MLDSAEDVAKVMQKYDLEALPVVNDDLVLLGRITIDDVVDFIKEEAEKDYQLAAGISQDVEADDGILQLTKARLPWLVLGLFGGLGSVFIMQGFEHVMATVPSLFFYTPLIAAMAGNVGVQSSAIIVQGIANNNVKGSMFSRLLKEIGLSLINGFALAVLVVLFGLIINQEFIESIAIATSMMSVIVVAALVGTFVPIVLDKRGIDPAIATGPFITTSNDILGIYLFFIIAGRHNWILIRGKVMKVLHVDSNHEQLANGLQALGCDNEFDYTTSKSDIQDKIAAYDGLIIRSRFTIDKLFLDSAVNLKFIGRVGAGLENIDQAYAEQKGITLLSAPEGNRNAVGEHTLGMLLALFNKLHTADVEVKNGLWQREANRGVELDGKTVGIIGYGNMGNAFAKKLQGFDAEVLCYDIKPNLGNQFAKQVSLEELQKQVDVLSLHTPQTPKTINLVNTSFINSFAKPFWLLNTARGTSVVTKDLASALKRKKILGAGLDVLEYEKKSFERIFESVEETPLEFKYLVEAKNVILSPHVAGWTEESKLKLAQTIVDKVKQTFF